MIGKYYQLVEFCPGVEYPNILLVTKNHGVAFEEMNRRRVQKPERIYVVTNLKSQLILL